MKAAIITIGDEVTSGQIINRNAAWLASELENLKILVQTHITVQDIEEQIIAALEFCDKDCDLLFTTGGLGPTRDDLTRNGIAAWAERDLKFDEASWTRLEKMFAERDLELAESNRQQCFFPEQSKVFVNPNGTANAFAVSPKKNSKQLLWSLPGPPREISGLWQKEIKDHVQTQIPNSDDPLTLLRWHCLGLSEAALGERVESILEGLNLQTGYRPHLPYVEVKVWCPESKLKENELYFKRLDRELSEFLIAKGEDQVAVNFLEKILAYDSVTLVDMGSLGKLAFELRTAAFHKKLWTTNLSILTDWDLASYDVKAALDEALTINDEHALVLVMGSLKPDGSWEVGQIINGTIEIAELRLPKGRKSATSEPSERALAFQAELSLIHWQRRLKAELN